MAIEGRIELIGSMFGTGKKPEAPRLMTPTGFRSFAAEHNRRYAAQGRRGRRGGGGE